MIIFLNMLNVTLLGSGYYIGRGVRAGFNTIYNPNNYTKSFKQFPPSLAPFGPSLCPLIMTARQSDDCWIENEFELILPTNNDFKKIFSVYLRHFSLHMGEDFRTAFKCISDLGAYFPSTPI